MTKDRFKDPINAKIWKEVTEKFREACRNKTIDRSSYRVGLYAGVNIALRNLGREPL
jgi:hypothetical protein